VSFSRSIAFLVNLMSAMVTQDVGFSFDKQASPLQLSHLSFSTPEVSIESKSAIFPIPLR